MKEWKKYPIKIIEKKDFPNNLRKIKKCPEKLYFRGNWNEKIFDKVLAIVGSRQMTRYGREIINKFMPEFVSQNITIISGFMYGVDTEAHQKCLESGGKTIAVLGGFRFINRGDFGGRGRFKIGQPDNRENRPRTK